MHYSITKQKQLSKGENFYKIYNEFIEKQVEVSNILYQKYKEQGLSDKEAFKKVCDVLDNHLYVLKLISSGYINKKQIENLN